MQGMYEYAQRMNMQKKNKYLCKKWIKIFLDGRQKVCENCLCQRAPEKGERGTNGR